MNGTRQISEKSAWSAYLVLTNGCWMVSVVVLLLYAVFRSVALLAAAVTLFCVILAGICHLAMYKRLLRKASVSMALRQGGNEMDRAHDRNQIRQLHLLRDERTGSF